MKKKAKLIIIVWKWLNENVHLNQRIGGGDANHDILLIKNQQHDILLRYDSQRKVEDSFDFLKEKIEAFKQTHYIQIFLHISDGYSKDKHLPILKGILEMDGEVFGSCYFFSNSNEHIYIQVPQSRYGLLGVDGNLGGEFNFELIDPFEISDTGQLFIKQLHFNNVWDYYYFKFRRKTFELKEQFIQYYWPLTEPGFTVEVHDPSSVLSQLSSYIEMIEGKPDEQGFNFTFIGDHADIQQAIYYKPEVAHLLVDLKNGFEKIKENPSAIKRADLLPIRNTFNNLLNELPEETYA